MRVMVDDISLPAINDIDLDSYPYAIIVFNTSANGYDCFLSEKPFVVINESLFDSEGATLFFKGDTFWTKQELESYDNNVINNPIVWSNHNIKKANYINDSLEISNEIYFKDNSKTNKYPEISEEIFNQEGYPYVTLSWMDVGSMDLYQCIATDSPLFFVPKEVMLSLSEEEPTEEDLSYFQKVKGAIITLTEGLSYFEMTKLGSYRFDWSDIALKTDNDMIIFIGKILYNDEMDSLPYLAQNVLYSNYDIKIIVGFDSETKEPIISDEIYRPGMDDVIIYYMPTAWYSKMATHSRRIKNLNNWLTPSDILNSLQNITNGQEANL